MRVLMVNSNRYKLPVPAMPFGLCYVSAALEAAGHEVEVLDLCFSRSCPRDITDAVVRFKPDMTGVSIRNIDTVAHYKTLFHLADVRDEVINPLKKVFGGPIVIGGTAVGISAAEMLDYFDLEYAIRGDGEAAAVELAERIESKLPLDGLGGLVRRENGIIVEDNPPLRIADLDNQPLLRQHRYIDLKSYRRLKAPIQLQTKRGCALKCTYCTYNRIEGSQVRLRDPERIATEIETYVHETGVRHFEFSDSTFNIPLDHAKAVLRAIEQRGLQGLNLQIMGLNPGAVDQELIDLMQVCNFKEVQVGAESGSDRMLKSLGKNFRKDAIIRTGDMLHEAGIPIMWYLMAGAPGETEETLAETLETMDRVASPWDLVVIVNAIRVYKDAPIAQQALRQNPDCTSDSFLLPVFYEPESISLDEIRYFNKKALLDHPNYLFPDEVQRVPDIALSIQSAVMRLLAPEQPWWRFNIALNRVLKGAGVYYVTRKLLERQYRHLSARA
jgi:radical SAM superfamily enzyme YgiQ (UPF0313 family)